MDSFHINNGTMFLYIEQGIWLTLNSVLAGIIVFVAYQAILFIMRKRHVKDYKTMSKLRLAAELLLTIYVCAILKITGILDSNLHFSFSPYNLLGFIQIPFVGGSIRMITLNFLLFVPYGFLSFFVFRKAGMNWHKALLMGFLSTLAIELLQAFKGRNPEIDDIIINTAGFEAGYCFSESVERVIKKEHRKSGIKRIVCIVVVSCLMMFLISIVANSDRKQAEEDSYYNGIAGLMGTLDKEIEDISEVNVYYQGMKKEARYDDKSFWDLWYENMGLKITNNAGSYVVEEKDISETVAVASEKMYIEVVYRKPQEFHFYNNREWCMNNVGYLLYCTADGSLWYGPNAGEVTFYAYYKDDDHPFTPEEGMITEVINWFKESPLVEELKQ